MKDLGPFFLVVIGLIFVWFVLLDSPSPSFTTTPTSNKSTEEAGGITKTQGVENHITLRQGGARRSDRHNEYLTLRAERDNSLPVNITGWTVESSVTGKKVRIGKGANLYRQSKSVLGPILLNPSDEAHLITARPPDGTAFRINKCSGYLRQFEDYGPQLPQQCPRLEDENLENFGIVPNAFEEPDDYDMCIDFIEDISRCERSFGSARLEDVCDDFVEEYASYEGCVALHKNDNDFFKQEWRIFLTIAGGDNDLWRDERDTIILRDSAGKIVDTLEY